MNNKKGFTLVELLAVIAILAILVIMALPAVLRMYRQSRINNFQNEVRSVYRTAQTQFLADSILLNSGQSIAYTNDDDCTTAAKAGANQVKKLDMTGNSNFQYYILLTVSGQVKTVRASNGTYSYAKTVNISNSNDSGIKVDEIKVEDDNAVSLDSNLSTKTDSTGV